MDYEKFVIGDRVEVKDFERGLMGEHGSIVDIEGSSFRVKLDGGREIDTSVEHCSRIEKPWVPGVAS